MRVDYIILFLSLSELTFSQPIDIEEKITEELKESEDVIEEDKKDPKGNCKEYRLVKKYADLEDLVKDNNTPVFVDKKYDETPYDIGEAWKKDNFALIAAADER